MQKQMEFTHPKTESFSRDGQELYFTRLSRGNTSGSNLTELNAEAQMRNGYFTHSDFMAHAVRFAYAQRTIGRVKAKRVLDLCCGRFPMLNFFHRNRSVDKFEYVGVDLRGGTDWLDYVGWKNGSVHFVQADVSKDNLDWLGEFDLVISFETWEHVPVAFQPKFMHLLYKHTKPGGFALVSTPNAGVSDSTADNHIDPDTGLSRELSYQDKLTYQETAGYQILASYGTFIQKRKIPTIAKTDDMETMLEFLSYGFGNILVAAPYPERSNNSLQVLQRPRSR